MIFTFTETYAKKRQADFVNLCKSTTNKTEAAKQSQSKPTQTETKAEKIDADFSNLAKPT